MHAAWIDRRGPATGIHFGELPVPAPGPSEVLVRVAAIAVNPVDTFVRSGAYATPMPFPFVIGRDLVGAIAACGPRVVGFAVGDPVWSNSLGHAGRQGASAEYAVVGVERLYPLAAGTDPVTMAAVAHPAATAYLALVIHGRMEAGDTVLVAGAAGNVGRAATTLASRAGARVIATASATDLETCRSLGAQHALDYRDPDLADRLREVAGGVLAVHVDTSGHHDLGLALELLERRGRIIVMAGLAERPELPVGALYTHDAQVLGFAISNAHVNELASAAHRINELRASGALGPRAVQELPLSAAAEAHHLLESGQASQTRLVLRP